MSSGRQFSSWSVSGCSHAVRARARSCRGRQLMSVAYPPEAPVSVPPPTREPPAPPAPPYTPPAPTPLAPPATAYTQGAPTPPAPPMAPARPSGGVVAGLILIAVGIVVLFGSWFPGRGAWLFLGLSVAFLIARVMTGRPG